MYLRKLCSRIDTLEMVKNMKGSIIIVAFFALGCICGAMGWIPVIPEDIDISFFTLAALMLCVGFSIGNNPETIHKFRCLNPRFALLPLATIFGTLCGALIAFIMLPHIGLTDTLAIGSGFAYYSLSSIFITEYRGAELGTIALLSNVSREIFTLLLTPLIARYFGKLAPISAGGATTMDTTFPIITSTCGQEFAVVSIYHGFVVDFAVPFLVTFFCII